MTRSSSLVAAAAACSLAGWSGALPAGQPQVNNPPEIQEFSISFGVDDSDYVGPEMGEAPACSRVPFTFGVTVKDHEGDNVIVTMDLDGDKKLDDAKKVVKGGEGTAVAKKSYADPGPVEVRYRACDKKKACSAVLRSGFDVILCPPEIGQYRFDTEQGDLDKTGILWLTAVDPQGDKVWYELDWDDDGELETKTDPASPDKEIKVFHRFEDHMMHVVSFRVCDQKDGCSGLETVKF